MKNEITYTLEADNCMNPKIAVSYRHLDSKTAFRIAKVMCKAFRDVRIVSEQTGEVAFNCYYDEDFFVQSILENEAIEMMWDIMNEGK
jgi:hypothetical protein